jgi:DNA-binding FrmR family transcriptional regulator
MDHDEIKKDLLQRLKKIEGQVKGIEKMVDDGRKCEDIIVQLSAARAALDTVAAKMMVSHASECLDRLPPDEAKVAVGRAINILTKMPR